MGKQSCLVMVSASRGWFILVLFSYGRLILVRAVEQIAALR